MGLKFIDGFANLARITQVTAWKVLLVRGLASFAQGNYGYVPLATDCLYLRLYVGFGKHWVVLEDVEDTKSFHDSLQIELSNKFVHL